MSVILAIVALGVLILVHELGHFLIAKLCGVYVERFSIGFGPQLLTRTKNGTEYCISAIPLGGYVKLHRMFEEEEAIEGKEGAAFFNKSYPKKIFVIAAGVLFNVIFAVVLMSAIFMIGYKSYSPLVGSVVSGSAAERAGFVAGDRILSVDGESVRSFEEFLYKMNDTVSSLSDIEVVRDGKKFTLPIENLKQSYTNQLGETVEVADTGVELYIPPVVGGIAPMSAAEKAGLQVGDRIVSIAGTPMNRWQDISGAVRTHAEEPLLVVAERDGESLELTITPIANDVSGETIGVLGVIAGGGDLTLRENPFTAVALGFSRTVEMTGLIYKGMWQLVSGKVSADNLGGPILIVKEAANSAKDGIERYFAFTAFISLNLAVLNILPVPILDGGYIVMYLFEAITRRKVGARVRETGQRIGFALLGLLMVFAFYNDIVRFIK
ncbi:MAG: RIP metalloprotease RseP [Deferribacteraceae bacterium]|jgi:regulator of sigma E protease|nr:RIP metalloprotease RseP [Deferribacteraceae bacterium]